MQAFRGLMLDAFGTLVEGAEEAVLEASKSICREHLPHVDPRVFSERWWTLMYELDDVGFFPIAQTHDLSLRRLLREYRVQLPAEEILAMVDDGWARAKVYPEVRAVLATLQDIPTCVVSNADEEFLLRLFERNGLHFKAVITSEFSRCYKPRPKIFRLALRVLGVPRSRVLFVGDSPESDVVGSRRLGIPVAWVNRVGVPYPEDLPRPDYEVADLRAVPEIFRRSWPISGGPERGAAGAPEPLSPLLGVLR